MDCYYSELKKESKKQATAELVKNIPSMCGKRIAVVEDNQASCYDLHELYINHKIDKNTYITIFNDLKGIKGNKETKQQVSILGWKNCLNNMMKDENYFDNHVVCSFKDVCDINNYILGEPYDMIYADTCNIYSHERGCNLAFILTGNIRDNGYLAVNLCLNRYDIESEIVNKESFIKNNYKTSFFGFNHDPQIEQNNKLKMKCIANEIISMTTVNGKNKPVLHQAIIYCDNIKTPMCITVFKK